MKKFSLSCLLTALLFLVPLGVPIAPDTGSLENERRQLATFPEIPTKIRAGTIKKFFQGVDAFFADHFPLRASLLDLTVALHEAGGDSLDMDNCYRGQKNWLFLGNNFVHCVDKLQGKLVLSGDALKRQAEKYVRIRDAAAECGAEFFIFIGPNKTSVYPEYLPTIIAPASQRFITPLVDALEQAGVKVYDPTERLLNSKDMGLLYYRTDTHWNSLGAYVAFEGFREYAGLHELPPVSFTEQEIYHGDLIGIGGYKRFPLSKGDHWGVQWKIPSPVRKEGHLFENTDALSNKVAWIFGDSFSEALMLYIPLTYKKVYLFSHADFETTLASQLPRPDTIIWEVVERHFAQF